jgi:hypothetical protein
VGKVLGVYSISKERIDDEFGTNKRSNEINVRACADGARSATRHDLDRGFG